jgi:prepilin-type N-terminal cleavage/methylation domain-containing protein
MMKSIKTARAFTLIELLVVISIIAILMSILMPALSKVKKQAKKTICASNFHQVGITHLSYANDYGQWIPRFTAIDQKEVHIPVGQPIGGVVPYFMGDKVYQLLKTGYGIQAEFWVCPSLRSRNSKRGFLGDVDFSQEDLPQNGDKPYPRNMGIVNLVGLVNMTNAQPSDVEECAQKPSDPSDKILAADLNIRWANDWSYMATAIAHQGKSVDGVILPEGANRLHTDGSTKWVDVKEMGPERDDDKTLLDDPRIPGKYDHWPAAGRDYYW